MVTSFSVPSLANRCICSSQFWKRLASFNLWSGLRKSAVNSTKYKRKPISVDQVKKCFTSALFTSLNTLLLETKQFFFSVYSFTSCHTPSTEKQESRFWPANKATWDWKSSLPTTKVQQQFKFPSGSLIFFLQLKTTCMGMSDLRNLLLLKSINAS